MAAASKTTHAITPIYSPNAATSSAIMSLKSNSALSLASIGLLPAMSIGSKTTDFMSTSIQFLILEESAVIG